MFSSTCCEVAWGEVLEEEDDWWVHLTTGQVYCTLLPLSLIPTECVRSSRTSNKQV